MGVDAVASRAPQQGTFFAVDPDCVGQTSRDSIPWEKNSQWLSLVAYSGTTTLISMSRDMLQFGAGTRITRGPVRRGSQAQPVENLWIGSNGGPGTMAPGWGEKNIFLVDGPCNLATSSSRFMKITETSDITDLMNNYRVVLAIFGIHTSGCQVPRRSQVDAAFRFDQISGLLFNELVLCKIGKLDTAKKKKRTLGRFLKVSPKTTTTRL